MREVLRSWKEIASHLRASVRTVQRWEREFRLPVRRLDAKRGAVVFAYRRELDNWLRDRSQTRLPLVQDSFFRTVFMDSQFPSLVVDDLPRILAANTAAAHLLRVPVDQLLGVKLDRILCADASSRLGDWAGFLKAGACFGQGNAQYGNHHCAGVEFVVKRFLPGLHVLSVLRIAKPWLGAQLRCQALEADFSFEVRPGSSPALTPGGGNHAPIGAS